MAELVKVLSLIRDAIFFVLIVIEVVLIVGNMGGKK